jgi:NAD(P)H dehydrogenase (quinone)
VRVSILFAHAARDSFCHATLEAFLRGLRESKHEYEVADLYRMAFVPTLDELAFARERPHGVESTVPADAAAQQACMRRSDALALVFPLW